MKVLTALVVVALALVGCAAPPASDDGPEPSIEAATQSPVPGAPHTPNTTEPAHVPTNATSSEVSSLNVTQEPFAIRLFNCDALMALVFVTADEMAKLVPDGFLTAELALGSGAINIAFLVCDAALFGNDTYENHVDILLVFTNGYPEGAGHGGGVDQAAILAMSSSTRFVTEAELLGMRTGTIQVTIEREDSTVTAATTGNETIQLVGVASPLGFGPWTSEFYLHGSSQGNLWMRDWASTGTTRSELTMFMQFQEGLLREVLGEGRGGLLASLTYEQMSFLPPMEAA